MQEPFVLEKRKLKGAARKYEMYATMLSYRADHDIIAQWSRQTGIPIVKMLSMCIAYCAENLAWSDAPAIRRKNRV